MGHYKLQIVRGAASQRLQLYLKSASTAYPSPLTGLAYNTPGLRAAWFRDGDAVATPILLTSGTAGVFAAGGFLEIDAINLPGLYELGVPDAVWIGATRATLVISGAAGLVEEVIEVQLTGNDPASQSWSAAFNAAIAVAVLAQAVENSVSVRQMLEAIGAAVAGNYDAATGSFRAVGNPGILRITTALAGGNRTNTTTL